MRAALARALDETKYAKEPVRRQTWRLWKWIKPSEGEWRVDFRATRTSRTRKMERFQPRG